MHSSFSGRHSSWPFAGRIHAISVFRSLRAKIFVDLALAQIAALGATVAFMLGHPAQSITTYGYSLSFIPRRGAGLHAQLGYARAQEALIGVIYVVPPRQPILRSIERHGAEHLKQILTGNILTSGFNDVALIVRCMQLSGCCIGSCAVTGGAGSLVWGSCSTRLSASW
jgi:ABC-type Mn2+/Zn2+ transport system permease subunit